MEMTPLKSTFSATSAVFLRIAAISTAALAFVGLYTFYRNNLWHPKVVINSVDYANGVANLTINGKEVILRGDSTFLIDYDWGIKFGYTYVLAWLVRKHIGRRQLMRAVYDIPEILEIHKLWQNSEINITIKTKTGSLITINRKNNINQ